MKPIVCIAEMEPSKGVLSSPDLEHLFHATDNKTSNLASLLPLFPSMPIRFTQNIAVELGISNGTEGRLLELEFSLGTQFRQSTLFGLRCLVSSTLPSVAYVQSKIIGKNIHSRFSVIPEHLPVTLYPSSHTELKVFGLI